MIEIIPVILSDSLNEVQSLMAQAEGLVERLQIDIVDGQFSQKRTISPDALGRIETDLKLDFHLMTKEPINWVESSLRGGAERIFGQIEKMKSQTDFVGKLQEIGLSIGLALDISTPVSDIDSVILNDLDAVLVLAVPAGLGGQKFENKALDKIKELDEIRVRDNTPFRICVDGGITEELMSEVAKAGVDEVAIGRRLFSGDLEENLKRFRKAAYV